MGDFFKDLWFGLTFRVGNPILSIGLWIMLVVYPVGHWYLSA